MTVPLSPTDPVAPVTGIAIPPVPGACLEPIGFSDLEGWTADRLEQAFTAFLATARALLAEREPLRQAAPTPGSLRAACAAAVSRELVEPYEIGRFFERWFQPWRIRPAGGEGFLTAYYEPEVEGSPAPDAEHCVPILSRPADLVSFAPGEPRPSGIDASLAGARLKDDGSSYQPYFDRAEIEGGALAGLGLEQLWLSDPVEAFLIHVQGSARIRLPDGRVTRLMYDGRNGHAYTSIGKVLVAEGHLRPEEATLEGLKRWLRLNPQEARRIMQLNRSYIFFRREDGMAADQGPIGGAGVALTPHRSLAIDRTIWPYGIPFFLETDLPDPDGGHRQIRQLMIAQDTGSAIIGPARADYFMGSGADAGRWAGLVREPARLSVLWPKQA